MAPRGSKVHQISPRTISVPGSSSRELGIIRSDPVILGKYTKWLRRNYFGFLAGLDCQQQDIDQVACLFSLTEAMLVDILQLVDLPITIDSHSSKIEKSLIEVLREGAFWGALLSISKSSETLRGNHRLLRVAQVIHTGTELLSEGEVSVMAIEQLQALPQHDIIPIMKAAQEILHLPAGKNSDAHLKQISRGTFTNILKSMSSKKDMLLVADIAATFFPAAIQAYSQHAKLYDDWQKISLKEIEQVWERVPVKDAEKELRFLREESRDDFKP
ncbi:hypothetical protein K493DRAFT_309275 [Basidiobolus meristosporus CBS 931.73]|uniref:Uncharacterized protein n=1 Tax=Basidiobolus meristosporus CBS 931.73 TaxID=1314790 RepID=A0A1Y1VRM8_9FUNG|nr:hypothetical protein K493DRAFT_368857 [Basidiobolus meristosporus CBS 931.73]ORX71740.1 hypothetical protein K493DRAFT_309275 [Basidiobolus meristosporus CBS 931.73]|eukprot:ORX63917.1 hypothetical protein K493DRAFT_368857 [Basidiobolus meristosporus CBS 931.73]